MIHDNEVEADRFVLIILTKMNLNYAEYYGLRIKTIFNKIY